MARMVYDWQERIQLDSSGEMGRLPDAMLRNSHTVVIAPSRGRVSMAMVVASRRAPLGALPFLGFPNHFSSPTNSAEVAGSGQPHSRVRHQAANSRGAENAGFLESARQGLRCAGGSLIST